MRQKALLTLVGIFFVFSIVLAGCSTLDVPIPEEEAARVQALSATITGTVKDAATGKTLSQVLVQVRGTSLSAVTDSLGRYTITGVPSGTFEVVATKEGYVPASRPVKVRVKTVITLNFSFQPGTAVSSTPAPTPAPTSAPGLDLVATYGWSSSNAIRWRDGVVQVYDATGYLGTGLVDLLNRWNAVIGGTTVFVLSEDPGSPIRISYNTEQVTALGPGTWGVTYVWWSNYALVKAEIFLLPCGTYYGGMQLCPEPRLYLHELGHAIGFGKHTKDGGVMDATVPNAVITTTVSAMLQTLYSLPVGYPLAKAPVTPKDGVAVMPLWVEKE